MNKEDAREFFTRDTDILADEGYEKLMREIEERLEKQGTPFTIKPQKDTYTIGFHNGWIEGIKFCCVAVGLEYDEKTGTILPPKKD